LSLLLYEPDELCRFYNFFIMTILTKLPAEAAEFIKKGGIVAFPTETVYGLGANVFDETAIEKIFEAKRRPNDNPLIAHVGNIGQIGLLAKVNETAEKFINAFFPAPLTLVLPKSARVSLRATANLETIGVRMPKNDLAVRFLHECGVPLVAPSANLSGRPSPTTWQAVFEDLDGRIDCILQGATATEIGLESTVVDCTSGVPLILRTGAITLEELQKIVPETGIYQLSKNDLPKSPGLKHRHYSPRARVVLTSDFKFQISNRSAFIGLKKPVEKFDFVKICSSVEDYAQSVFDFFRQCDRQGIEEIFCQTVNEKGIGLALMDRLKRASEN
jgi:L-threonylcarbamoyladenylate synthase